jgi:integrase
VGKELERHVAHSSIATVLARDVTPEQAVSLIREILDRGSPHAANRVRRFLHAAYEVSLNARLNPGSSINLIDPKLKINPLANVRPIFGLNTARERYLDKAELADFWRRLVNMGDLPSTPIPVRALRLTVLLGGQRCEQLLRVRIEHVDLEAESILILDSKGNRNSPRKHLLPLLNEALKEVKFLVQHALDVGSQYLFPGRPVTQALTQYSVSRIVTRTRKEMMASGTAKRQFQFSDLRRTAETQLADLGVTREVRAQLQSHGLSGIQERHYDRHEYMKDKREALRTWHEFLRGLLSS